MTPLPPALRQAIAQAYSAMAGDPQHQLKPFSRLAIYRTLDGVAGGKGQEARARLAILTARRVLSLWLRERPNDDLPIRLLTLAEDVLNGTADVAVAEATAGDAWEQLELLGHDETVPESCFSAGEAAREALVATLGRNPFDGALISTQDTDADLDPWCSDTPLWAVTAWAGGTWEPQSDPARRREFWHWWLTEAVPQAWHAAARPEE